ncbi:ATP-binding protein [Natronosalvus vescus]|uniref:ATP-binding protein n=1 Tax=Natronosalvus vescus TaxID=2953881 RepID=UPI0020902F23|nr:ATP-binding protein [Natronosalvus vescus]
MTDYWTDFAQESDEQITSLNNSLLTLERNPHDDEAMEEIFRTAHTLKGNCGAMGLTRASDLAHAIEDLLDGIRRDEIEVTAAVMDAVFDAVDELEAMLEEAAASKTIERDPSPTIGALRSHIDPPAESTALSSPTAADIEQVLARFEAPADDEHDAFFVRLSIVDDESVNNGQLVVEALIDAFDFIGTDPSQEAIANDEYGTSFDAVFGSAVGEDAIAAALEPVEAVAAFEIVDVTDEFEAATETTSAAEITAEPTDDIGDDGTDHDIDPDDLSVDELLEEFSEFDDLDAMVEEVEDDDLDVFDEMGDAGSFDDLLGESTTSDDETAATATDVSDVDEAAETKATESQDTVAPGTTSAAEADESDGDDVDDAGAVFAELKDEVEMVGFDELQAELDELEFDEFDSDDEVGMDELLGEDVDVDDNSFLDIDEDLEDVTIGDESSSDEVEPEDVAPAVADSEGADDETIVPDDADFEAFAFDDLEDETAADARLESASETDEPEDVAALDGIDFGDGDIDADVSVHVDDDGDADDIDEAEDGSVDEPGDTISDEVIGDDETVDKTDEDEPLDITLETLGSTDESTDDFEADFGLDAIDESADDFATVEDGEFDPVEESFDDVHDIDDANDIEDVNAVTDDEYTFEDDETAASSDFEDEDAGGVEDDVFTDDAFEDDGFDEVPDTEPTTESFETDSAFDLEEPSGFDSDSSTAGTESASTDPDRIYESVPPLPIPELSIPSRATDDRSDTETDETQSVRVDIEQVDTLLNLVEGLVTSRVRLRDTIDQGADPQTIEHELDDLEDITSELQETVMDVRLVPLETVANRLPRTVRDIARDQDKDVSFEIDGESVELDRGILSQIGDPLIHLVRNAVDHGIESPDEREAADKPREGTVRLAADRARDRVTIQISDDGRGLDPARLREAAVEADVLDADEADAMDDDDVYDLVFHPGLSTATEVTDVSGRGVGMDVVKRTIENLDGTVTVDSDPNEGTTVTMELPVTVAIADVLFFEIGGEEFGIPIKAVHDIDDARVIETVDGEPMVTSGTEDVPVLDLSSRLETPRYTDPDGGMVIRIRDSSRPIALRCDTVHGQQEVVVKPFEGFLSGVPGISGATIRGRGEVVNILDVNTL